MAVGSVDFGLLGHKAAYSRPRVAGLQQAGSRVLRTAAQQQTHADVDASVPSTSGSAQARVIELASKQQRQAPRFGLGQWTPASGLEGKVSDKLLLSIAAAFGGSAFLGEAFWMRAVTQCPVHRRSDISASI